MSIEDLFLEAGRCQWRILDCWDCKNDNELYTASCRYGNSKWYGSQEDQEYNARRLIKMTELKHPKKGAHE